MRLPLFALLLLALAACTTTVPEPDATIPAPDWRDAALVEAIASDAVTAQHRLGSAGPISLPASFLTAGGDLATGGVVTQAQSGAISFTTTGTALCAPTDTVCGLAQFQASSDVATATVGIGGQAAYGTATAHPNGGGVLIQGGSSAGGATTATGGAVVLQGGTSAATTSGTAGSVTALLGAPVGAGSEAYFAVDRGSSVGTHRVVLGAYPASTSAGMVAFNSTTVPALYGDGATYTYLTNPSAVGVLINGATFPVYATSGYMNFYGTSMTAFGGSAVVDINNGTAISTAVSGGVALQSVAGALNVVASGNSTPSLSVGATVTGVSTTLAAGYAAVTPVNGANSLSAANSAVANLNLVAGATAAVTITDALTPAAAKGALLFIRNNTTQTVTFGWSSGTTITIATLTSALVTSDGTNAIKLMAGT